MAEEKVPRPSVVVSRCLGFDSCRYNGQTIPDSFVDLLGDHVDYVTVCPEVEIGLGVPRQPIRIAMEDDERALFQPSTGRDVTAEMTGFVDEFLSSLEDIDGFLLKNRSPSCGITDVKIFNSKGRDAQSTRGAGFFGGEVQARFPLAAVEDEGRLKSYDIRHHFLTRLYAAARFRAAHESGRMRDIIDFHSRYKLLFMAYNQSRYRACGKIVANHDKLPVEEVYDAYADEMAFLLERQPKYTSMINTLQHALGWVSEGLSAGERKEFLDLIEEYRDERIPLVALLRLIRTWAVRFENDYLMNQYLLQPFPMELVRMADSGKGRPA